MTSISVDEIRLESLIKIKRGPVLNILYKCALFLSFSHMLKIDNTMCQPKSFLNCAIPQCRNAKVESHLTMQEQPNPRKVYGFLITY